MFQISAHHNPKNGTRRTLALALSLTIVAIFVLRFSASAVWPAAKAAQDSLFPPAGSWYTYANGDDILTLVVEDSVLWAGTRAGGLVRWDTSDRTYVQFLKPQTPLAGNTVRDIYIDPQGNKWLATDGGLNVLDDKGTPDVGDDLWYTVTRQTSGIPSDHVTAIAADEAGYIWVGTGQHWDADRGEYAGGGLAKLDTKGTLDPSDDEWLQVYTSEGTRRTRGDEIILGLASNNVTGVLPVSGNTVWVTTQPERIFDRSQSSPQWRDIFGGLSRLDHGGTADPSDDEWQTWNCENGGEFACTMTQIRMGPAGYVWVATEGRGLMAFAPDGRTLNPEDNVFNQRNDGLASDYVDAIAFGSPGDPAWQDTVWVSTYRSLSFAGEGVSVLNHGSTIEDHGDDVWNGPNPTPGEPVSTEDGLDDNRVQALALDGGRMWMGVGGINGAAHGVAALDLQSKTFQSPLVTAESTLPYNYITDLAIGPPGTRWEDHVWIATGHKRTRRYGAGTLLLDTQGTQNAADDTWTQFTKENTDDVGQHPWSGLSSNNLTSLAIDGDDVWFGGRSVKGEWRTEGWVWLDGGLSVYNGEDWTNRTMASTGGGSAGLRGDTLSDVAVGCQDEIWIGVGGYDPDIGPLGLGINILDPAGAPHNLTNDEWRDPFQYDQILSNLITEIVPDCERGRMWIGHAPHLTDFGLRGGGVGYYAYATEQWTQYTTADGIESYVTVNTTGQDTTGEVQSVAMGSDGRVWAGTWGTQTMTRVDLISDWPYVPAVVNTFQDSNWQSRQFDYDGWVSAIAEDQNGVVWIGTSRGGIDTNQDGQEDDDVSGRAKGGIHLTDGTDWVTWIPDTPSTNLAQRSSLVTNDIAVIEVGPDGDVWIGTQGWGVMRFHPGEPATATPTTTSVEPATPTPTSTITPTPTDISPPSPTPTPTDTQPVTATPTPTASSTTPTVTATPSPQHDGTYYVYLSLVARSGQQQPIPTGTPTSTTPQFTCSDWCTPGSSSGIWRQVVTSDKSVDDWRAYVKDFLVGMLTQEEPTQAALDAPEGLRVRIEALYQNEWHVACDSIVECPPP